MACYELDETRFVGLLRDLIGEVAHLQNNPPTLVPQETLAANHVKARLDQYTKENGGPLELEFVEYIKGRANVIVKYIPPNAQSTVAFVGSHLDVVPADPTGWKFDPFSLTIEGDELRGRGTTDCLGHVALLTDLFCQFGEKKPDLKVAVWAVFIASEENSSIPDVGVDMLLRDGKLEPLKNGPVYWVDSADSQPCIGTAAAITWKVRAEGKLFHSGLPHKAINSIELVSEAVAAMQHRFYKDFPAHAREAEYGFATPSTCKPTQTRCAVGGLNQIPPWAEVEGDIRLTPFYDAHDCEKKVATYIDDINANLSALPVRGPVSKYAIAEEGGETRTGRLVFSITGATYEGIACSLTSPGFTALRDATITYKGEAKPYSICGSLPLVADLQKAGFDLQVCGYGLSHVYHGDNEFCRLSEMKIAMRILSAIVFKLGA